MKCGWKEYRLGEVCTKVTDGTHDTPKSINLGLPLIKGKDISKGFIDFENCEKISREDHNKIISRSHPEIGDVLFSNIGNSIGDCVFINTEREFSIKNVALFKPDETLITPKFLFYTVKGEKFYKEIWNSLSGVAQPFASLKLLRNHKILIPSIPIQKKITSILSGYDDLIENNLKRIKLLEEKAQLTYEEWFVHMKFPGYESVEIDKGTGLPEGWKKVKLEDVLTLNYGKALKASNRIQGYYSVYGSSGIVGSHNEFLINGPGVIVGRKGNVGSVFWADDSFYAIDTVYYVTSELSLYYCYFYLKGESFVNNDAAVPGLSRKAAYLKDAIKPPLEVIKKFELEIKKYFDVVRNLKKQNQLLKEARDILLPRLMTGMIDVEKLDLEQIKKQPLDIVAEGKANYTIK